jgi:tetratricopeptide (TPR) repeat protein
MEAGPNAYSLMTRGAVQYRGGDYANALKSLEQAGGFAKINSAFWWPHIWLIQALCHAKLGNDGEANSLYDKSVAWLKQSRSLNAAFRHDAETLRDEVEALLKQQEPASKKNKS